MTRGADIQVEDGNWSKVHNDIWESLAKTPLTGGEFRCLMFLFRKTYGFKKKEDKISLSQWSEGTGMKRQNVWVLLQSLIARKVIYCLSTGPKRAATWGFNKYVEQWGDESVMPQHDSSVMPDHDSLIESVMPEHDTSVMVEHDSEKTSVMPQHDKSVIPPHERTKDKKESSSLLAADSDDAISLVRLAYETVCKIGPPMREQDGRANLVAATAMIERYGYAACIRGLSTLKERYNASLNRSRHGISAPIPYLRSIMEDDLGVPVSPPVTVDFALEDITP